MAPLSVLTGCLVFILSFQLPIADAKHPPPPKVPAPHPSAKHPPPPHVAHHPPPHSPPPLHTIHHPPPHRQPPPLMLHHPPPLSHRPPPPLSHRPPPHRPPPPHPSTHPHPPPKHHPPPPALHRRPHPVGTCTVATEGFQCSSCEAREVGADGCFCHKAKCSSFCTLRKNATCVNCGNFDHAGCRCSPTEGLCYPACYVAAGKSLPCQGCPHPAAGCVCSGDVDLGCVDFCALDTNAGKACRCGAKLKCTCKLGKCSA